MHLYAKVNSVTVVLDIGKRKNEAARKNILAAVFARWLAANMVEKVEFEPTRLVTGYSISNTPGDRNLGF